MLDRSESGGSDVVLATLERDPALLASPVTAYLERLLERHASLTDGEVASYIPELATARPESFAICVVTTDGTVYEVGDSRQLFTIQSMSKPLTYGMALERHDHESVRARIGVEPTGDAFNAISLAPDTGTPLNPMVNAGAIVAAGLVAESSDGSPLERVLETYSAYAGRPLSINWTVFRSESATGHRNRAIGHLLRSSGVLNDGPDPTLELYFQQCSVEVHCRDLAVIGATLANGGLNPLTGERAVRRDVVRSVLSVMTSCGMYDSAGAWLYDVGLPAKSGVAGGVLAVLPGRLGVGVFSPPLDARGNSVRGVAVCRDLSRDLALHLVRSGETPAHPIRTAFTLAERGSKRMRSVRERELLDALGSAVLALELQGELDFRSAEAVSHAILDAEPVLAVLDLRRVTRSERSAVRILADLAAGMARRGGRLVLSGPSRHERLLTRIADATDGVAPATFSELDLALEWGEEAVLAASGEARDPAEIPLADHDLLSGLDPRRQELVLELLAPRSFAAGDVVVHEGEDADEIFLITRGQLSVLAALPDGGARRLATLGPGMTFGELAVVSRSPRSATVVADTNVESHSLALADLDRLGERHPDVKAALLENVLRSVVRATRRLSREVALLAG